MQRVKKRKRDDSADDSDTPLASRSVVFTSLKEEGHVFPSVFFAGLIERVSNRF